MMYRYRGYLIDATQRGKSSSLFIIVVATVHLGLDGYLDKQRAKKLGLTDVSWNYAYCPNIHLAKGSLSYAKWKPFSPSSH